MAVRSRLRAISPLAYELRVALMDRTLFELSAFHGIELRDQVIDRDGHWFLQCYVHKYKNLVQNWRHLELGAAEAEGFSRSRLLYGCCARRASCRRRRRPSTHGAIPPSPPTPPPLPPNGDAPTDLTHH